MKKLAKFLSLALLTVGCCFSAHAKIDGKPATPEQIKQFEQIVEDLAITYAEKYKDTLDTFFETSEKNAHDFRIENNLQYKNPSEEYKIYTDAIGKKLLLLNSSAYSSFALTTLEKLNIQCGYVQLYHKNCSITPPPNKKIRVTTDDASAPAKCNKAKFYAAVIFSLSSPTGARQWYICDLFSALSCACYQLNSHTNPQFTNISDWKTFLQMPINDYISNYSLYRNELAVRNDNSRDNICIAYKNPFEKQPLILSSFTLSIKIRSPQHTGIYDWMRKAEETASEV